jgi:hypothetical protein
MRVVRRSKSDTVTSTLACLMLARSLTIMSEGAVSRAVQIREWMQSPASCIVCCSIARRIMSARRDSVPIEVNIGKLALKYKVANLRVPYERL